MRVVSQVVLPALLVTAFFDALDAAPPKPRSLKASVRVDATNVVRVIPATLYGTSAEWTHGGNGIWLPQDADYDSVLLFQTWLLRPSLIRFPGGLLSEFYHWRDGVGPGALRPTTETWPGGPFDRHDFGTSEALGFARRLGAELLITANAGTGTALEAADWVSFVNASGTEVKYWEVGNELYNSLGYTTTLVTIPPEVYAARFVDFARAMKQRDPSIKIGAIGGENWGNYQFNYYPGWNQIVLSAAGSEMDYLAVHNAFAPINLFDQHRDVRTVYSAMLAAPIGMGRNLRTLGEQIDLYAPGRDITIGVTEWAPLFHFWPTPYILHTKTLGSALYVASVLKQFIESPRTELACSFALVDESFMGWTGKRLGSWLPNATQLALQLYTRHFGQLLVPSVTVSPTYDSPSIGVVAAEPNVPYLDVVSSLSADGKKLYIMAINKHFDSPIQARISLDGFNPAPRATARRLQGTGIDAHTGTDAPPGFWGFPAQDEVNPRFLMGAPWEVQIVSGPVYVPRSTFNVTFPPFSATSLEISRR